MADEPQASPARPPERSGAGYAAIVAAAVLVAAPLTASFEGLRTHPYGDPAPRHTMTVCYGETNAPMRVYSADECGAMLRAALSKRYAPIILRCVPAFADRGRLYVFAASIDASYNGGPGKISNHKKGFCGSLMAIRFRAGAFARGCDAFRGWHTLPGTAAHNGLVRRREAERALCLKALAPPPPSAPAIRADLQLCVPLKPYVAPPLGPARRGPLHPDNSEIG